MTYQILQGDNRQTLKTLEDRFKLKYKIDEKTGCWNWIGSKDREGYGVIWDNRKKNNIRAHRLSLEIVGRKIDDKLVTLHQCDNKSCVNPNHLKEGTTQQNTKEAKERGLLTNMTEKRKKKILSLTDLEFDNWCKKFDNKTGKALSNLTTAKRWRDEQ